MDFQNLTFEKKNQIAYITINRPKVLNALNMAVMEELRQAFACSQRRCRGARRHPHRLGREGVRRRRRHRRVVAAQRGFGQGVHAQRPSHHRLDREPGQADYRLHQRIRARWRMRAGHGLHHASGQRERQARPARGEARTDPGLRRNAAPVAPGRQRYRDAASAHGRDDLGAGGASYWTGERSCACRRV